MDKFIIGLSKKAGAEIRKHFNRDRIVKIKSKSQIVTTADLISEKIILKALRKKFPTHRIISEEAGSNQIKSDFVWSVDPLDGTTNYSIGNPLFAVQLALFYKLKPILSVAYAPVLNELYFAKEGKGAFLNGKRMKVSKVKKMDEAIVTYCHGSMEKHLKRAVKVYQKIKLTSLDSRQLGSAALELGFVAAGRTECIIIPGAHSWDVGAGTLMVREAGGKVTDFKGQDWNLNSIDMVGTNGLMHKNILKLLKNI